MEVTDIEKREKRALDRTWPKYGHDLRGGIAEETMDNTEGELQCCEDKAGKRV